MGFLVRRVSQTELIGNELPWGYGVAYREFYHCVYVLAPIPLNFVIGWLHILKYRVVRWLENGPALTKEIEAEQAYLEGVAHGARVSQEKDLMVYYSSELRRIMRERQ